MPAPPYQSHQFISHASHCLVTVQSGGLQVGHHMPRAEESRTHGQQPQHGASHEALALPPTDLVNSVTLPAALPRHSAAICLHHPPVVHHFPNDVLRILRKTPASGGIGLWLTAALSAESLSRICSPNTCCLPVAQSQLLLVLLICLFTKQEIKGKLYFHLAFLNAFIITFLNNSCILHKLDILLF